ncbi:MAG: hypothetical protein BJ554DRAFT_2799 [Olpidium bornovanus]|uniref:Uncharacterized protein n=1 Tax=Olpidium bornovanus TaxID=278681 RepID=A0A8H7ZPS3_9FUNG|nr:MAG: hypothetical protein BJ554DRAFT_2799 [Olpidium bornovanus]
MATVHLADLCATVAVLYVLPTGMARQAPVLAKWLRAADPRARVVTIDYSLPGWKPVTGAEVRRPGSKVSRWLFLYDSKSANAAADGAA